MHPHTSSFLTLNDVKLPPHGNFSRFLHFLFVSLNDYLVAAWKKLEEQDVIQHDVLPAGVNQPFCESVGATGVNPH